MWLRVVFASLGFLRAAVSTTYPSLIQCVCNTTLASTAVVSTSTSSSQTQKITVPSCVDDVFATTGIRWYIDGPIFGNITYWRKTSSSAYSDGRAAQRLIAMGYRCERVQLYDSTDTSVY